MGQPDIRGWRTINNTASGSHSYLTSNYINNLRVLTVDKKVEETGQTMEIDSVVLHPRYNNHAYNDIAIVKLKPNNYQLWKVSSDMKIVNKGWDWQFQNETWVLPSVGSEGNIEHNITGQVLG